MKTFTKRSMVGTLGRVTIDHITSNRKWTTRDVLMLVDADGRTLSNAQFRTNAFKQAESFFLSEGWEVKEN